MPAITAIYNEIIATPEITALLNTYAYTTGSTPIPAVFTSAVIPQDLTGPYAILSVPASSSGGNSEDRGHIAGLSMVDIVVYDEKARSSKSLRATAQLIWETIHRATMEVTGYEVWVLATPPAQLSDPDGFPGYVVSCKATIRELDKGVGS